MESIVGAPGWQRAALQITVQAPDLSALCVGRGLKGLANAPEPSCLAIPHSLDGEKAIREDSPRRW